MVARDGDAAVAHHLLEEVLVHRERRRRRRPRRRTATPASSSSPCTVPSSPNGPCRIGQHDVDRAERRERPPSPPEPAASRRRAAASTSSCGAPPSSSSQRAVAADRDVDDVVALGIERLEHRARRRERDLVLARAAAGEHGDADAAGSRSRGRACRRRRRVGRRRRAGRRRASPSSFGGCCVPPAGVWLRTTPSCGRIGHVAGGRPSQREARRLQVCSAEPSVGARHVRHRRRLRALRDRQRDRRALAGRAAAARALVDDGVRRLVARRRRVGDVEAGGLRARERRLVDRLADHVGHRDGLRPLRDVDPHRLPVGELRARPAGPARAPCPRASSTARSCSVGLQVRASSARRPRRSTACRRASAPPTFGIPVETQIVHRARPSGCRCPAIGSLPEDEPGRRRRGSRGGRRPARSRRP